MGPDPRVRTVPLRALSHHVTLAMLRGLPFSASRSKRGRNSSPSSTCRSTAGASSPL